MAGRKKGIAPEDLHSKLKEDVKRFGFTQREIADKLGTTQENVSKALTGYGAEALRIRIAQWLISEKNLDEKRYFPDETQENEKMIASMQRTLVKLSTVIQGMDERLKKIEEKLEG